MNTSQRKWSTPEKECYAIYYSLIKLEHLLLDTEFTIHTDHKNLTFLDESANARVNRWKLALQEYRFTIEYIKGADNVVAVHFHVCALYLKILICRKMKFYLHLLTRRLRR